MSAETQNGREKPKVIVATCYEVPGQPHEFRVTVRDPQNFDLSQLICPTHQELGTDPVSIKGGPIIMLGGEILSTPIEHP